mmetsp:Transcript_41641/g.114881  ORF Transcript_41641/g.114881 Transcript_41641/m.114881 type:complete len:347 (-) Transcript_41641:129-1169(-)
MVKGPIHPNGSNFHRGLRFDIVARMRKHVESGLVAERPRWLEWCERVPPFQNQTLHLQARTVRNPYRRMLEFLFNKYPDLRFQDCYVDGNDWSKGNDVYRDDHPAMQFVARQLDLMRTEGMSKKEAFLCTEKMFRERREHLEREQKIMMAQAFDLGLRPMFTTGRAYLEVEKAKNEAAHLNNIRLKLRQLKRRATETVETKEEAAESASGTEKPKGDKHLIIDKQKRLELLRTIGGGEKKQTEAEQAGQPKSTKDDLKAEGSTSTDPDKVDDSEGSAPRKDHPDDASEHTSPVHTSPAEQGLRPSEGGVIIKPSTQKKDLGRKSRKSRSDLSSMLQGGGVMGEDQD